MKRYKDSTEDSKKNEGLSPLHLLIKNLFKRLHAPHFLEAPSSPQDLQYQHLKVILRNKKELC